MTAAAAIAMVFGVGFGFALAWFIQVKRHR